ncbi:hypothetical protein D3C78_1957450 [compost metagenome]
MLFFIRQQGIVIQAGGGMLRKLVEKGLLLALLLRIRFSMELLERISWLMVL